MVQFEDLVFASSLGIILIALTTLIQQPNPNPNPNQPRLRHSPPPLPAQAKSFPPAVNIQSAYNEDTIITLLTELYSLYVRLAYLSPSDIVYPNPITGRYHINRSLCNSIGIDQSVISLMERMPYMDGPHRELETREELNKDARSHGNFLFPGSRAYSFLRDHDIKESRDPQCNGDNPRLDYLLGHDIALSTNLRDGMILILDTKANTVRMIDSNDKPDSVNPEGYVQERPEDPDHYRNYYTQDAPSYLKDLINNIRALEIIPIAGSESWWMDMVLDVNDKKRCRVKLILEKQFGWPDNFRQDDWAREGEKIWDDVFRLDTLNLDEGGCIVATAPYWFLQKDYIDYRYGVHA